MAEAMCIGKSKYAEVTEGLALLSSANEGQVLRHSGTERRASVAKLPRVVRTLLSLAMVSATMAEVQPAAACTTFLAQHEGQPIFGRNYDWSEGAALVSVNPRGLSKVAVPLSSQDQPLSWTAKYASITFNQYGIELPTGGMNEAGVVVEQMWLDSTTYPSPDSRPTVNELQWIQYALDSSATVEQWATLAAAIRLSPAYAKVHYLVCDVSSACATFEYLNGQLVVTRAPELRVKTLANDTYAESVAYLAKFDGFGGTMPTPTSADSLDRFVRAATMANSNAPSTIPDSAFGILDSVAQPDGWTKWSIVYAPKQGTVYFRTAAMPKVKSVRFDAFALGCPSPRKTLDIDADRTGDVSGQFVDYAAAANRSLVTRTLGGLGMPDMLVSLLGSYPDSLTCAAPPLPNSGSAGAGFGPSLAGAAGSAAAVLGTAGSPSTIALGNAGTLAVAPGTAGSAPNPLSAAGSGGERIYAATSGGAAAVQSKKSDDSGCRIHAPRSGSYGQYGVVLGLAMLIRRRRAAQAKKLISI